MMSRFLILILMLLSQLGFAQQGIYEALNLIGLSFTEAETDSMSDGVSGYRSDYDALRELPLPNEVSPSLYFNPLPFGFEPSQHQNTIEWKIPDDIDLPDNRSELAFYSVSQLASLIEKQKITSVELTRFFLERLRNYGDTLECIITLTDSLALAQAVKADAEIAAGLYRGPLHGIPYGIKDLFSTPGYRTTWGAMPYKEQQLDRTATVVRRLEEAGAILVAKLTLGALAWGDVWYGGTTRNPWNLKQGSSGSSAGSASATAAGLVPFAIGTETLGSIVSPSTRCGTTGLRPTFGRVSRYGAMALSWTMDKIGPICRNALDCALVFDAIRGVDSRDRSTIPASFNIQFDSITELKVGYFANLFPGNQAAEITDPTLLELETLGIDLVPVDFKPSVPISQLRFILNAEAAAAFDELTRSNRDDEMVRQIKRAWPNTFRQARLIPAVEYLQANRLRTLLIEELHELFQEYDVIVTPTFGGDQLTATNLTGHPALVLPNGFDQNGRPGSITFLANLFDEASLLMLGHAYQSGTDYEDKHPELFR